MDKGVELHMDNGDDHKTSDDSHDILMNRKEAAKYISFSPNTMAVWDCTKRYDLKPIKIGRSVRYRKSDLDKFLQQRTKP